jgi:hypothetical protein
MSPILRPALCPIAPRRDSRTSKPPGLACSLTLPGEPRSAGIARTAVGSALRMHALDRYVPPAVQAASELVAVTHRLAPGADLYLSVRHRDDELRLVVWDQHPRHVDPVAVSPCEAAITGTPCGRPWPRPELATARRRA